MFSLTQTAQLISHYKIRDCVFRFFYAVEKKNGRLQRRCPAQTWLELEPHEWFKPEFDVESFNPLQIFKYSGTFFFNSDSLPKPDDICRDKILAEAESIKQHKFRYFFQHAFSLGFSPDWFLNPVTGKRAHPACHWSRIDFFDPAVGDIKFIWEPSRFAWAFTLVRAYAVSGDNSFAEKFWTLFESWIVANPPNCGPNYACGQECAIRVIALCFALFGCAAAPATTPDRLLRLLLALAVHADRIEKNINFAISTRSNHALTEAAGLYTVGILFPMFRRAATWRKLGKKILVHQGLEQIYADGTYIQHSMNYHRLMLHIFIWVIQLGRLNDDIFPQELICRLQKATRFLYAMQDDISGQVPNYGANDGALLLPLDNCDFADYRPTLQAAHLLFYQKRLYARGPWDEDLLWLFGTKAVHSALDLVKKTSHQFPHGGYYLLTNRHSRVMVRNHTYRHRPSQADMLHVDLWWKGINVLRDSGTFMYHCEKPWQHYFISTAAHNTVQVDGQSQMIKGPRFIWFNWTKSGPAFFDVTHESTGLFFSGSHHGYKRAGSAITHCRSIASLFDGQTWIIADDILGAGQHKIKLYWHLADVDYNVRDSRVELQSPAGLVCVQALSLTPFNVSCYYGDEHIPAGFESRYYGERTPAPTMITHTNHTLPVRFITIVTLGYALHNCALRQNRLTFPSPTDTVHTILLRPPADHQTVFEKIYPSPQATL